MVEKYEDLNLPRDEEGHPNPSEETLKEITQYEEEKFGDINTLGPRNEEKSLPNDLEVEEARKVIADMEAKKSPIITDEDLGLEGAMADGGTREEPEKIGRREFIKSGVKKGAKVAIGVGLFGGIAKLISNAFNSEQKAHEEKRDDRKATIEGNKAVEEQQKKGEIQRNDAAEKQQAAQSETDREHAKEEQEKVEDIIETGKEEIADGEK